NIANVASRRARAVHDAFAGGLEMKCLRFFGLTTIGALLACSPPADSPPAHGGAAVGSGGAASATTSTSASSASPGGGGQGGVGPASSAASTAESSASSAGGQGGSGGAPGQGANVTVHVVNVDQTPASGIPVVVNDANGAIAQQLQTGSDGNALVFVPAGGLV